MPFTRIKDIIRARVYEYKNRDTSDEEDRIDDNLPLGLRIGSTVSIDFLETQIFANELFMKVPKKTDLLLVSSYAQFSIPGFNYTQFYFDNSDELFLEVTTQPDGDIESVALKCLHDSDYPQDEESAGFWLDEEEGFIGNYLATIPRFPENHQEQDSEGNPIIKTPHERADELAEFLRQIDDENQDRIKPFHASVTLYASPYDDEPLEIEMEWMHYHRGICLSEDSPPEFTELLDAAAVFTEDEAVINIHLGVPIAESQLDILPPA